MTARPESDMKVKGMCPDCGGSMVALSSGNNLPASEWYCSNCHESYRMNEEDARYFLSAEAQRRAK